MTSATQARHARCSGPRGGEARGLSCIDQSGLVETTLYITSASGVLQRGQYPHIGTSDMKKQTKTKQTKTKQKVRKPKPKVSTKTAYDWAEIVKFIKLKYGKDVRDWSGRYADNPYGAYQDLWHDFMSRYDIYNGSIIHIYIPDILESLPPKDWKLEPYEILHNEFGPEFDILVEW